MSYTKREGTCPVCKKNGTLTRKWVLNKYKKKYSYDIYSHNGTIHYSNQSKESRRSFKKRELEQKLIEEISSEKFKQGLFNAGDIKRLLESEYPNVDSDSIRNNLHRLSGSGILESVNRGRYVFFLNRVSRDRLSFIDDSMEFSLEDLDNDLMYKGHVSISEIRNDKAWPLYFLPYRIIGDTDTRFSEIKFSGYDTTNGKELKTILLEDTPRDKRLLLKLSNPLFPNESIRVRFSYDWPEPKQTFVFSAATYMNSFGFSLAGNERLKVSITVTSSAWNEVRDLSRNILNTNNKKWKSIYSFKLKSVQPFSILQFRWKRP